MGDSFVGEWAMRISGGIDLSDVEVGKAHLVQSEITDRLVMKCGRQMKFAGRRGILRLHKPISEKAYCEACKA